MNIYITIMQYLLYQLYILSRAINKLLIVGISGFLILSVVYNLIEFSGLIIIFTPV